MGTKQKEVLVAESRPFASYGRMKILKLHTKSALFGAGLVVLVGVLSAQTFNHQFFAVRVLETPQMTIDQISDPVQISMVKGNRQATTIEIGLSGNADYIVPLGKYLVIKRIGLQGAMMSGSQARYFNASVGSVPPLYPDSMGQLALTHIVQWSSNEGNTSKDFPLEPIGGSELSGETFIAYPGDRVFHAVYNPTSDTVTDYKWIIQGYLVDSD